MDRSKSTNIGISQAEVGVDRLASELAIQRLQREIAALVTERRELVQDHGYFRRKARPISFYIQTGLGCTLIWFFLCLLLPGMYAVTLNPDPGIETEPSTLSLIIFFILLVIPFIVAGRYFQKKWRKFQENQAFYDISNTLAPSRLSKINTELSRALKEIEEHQALLRRHNF